MLLVASETGHVYTFATQKLQPMITSEGLPFFYGDNWILVNFANALNEIHYWTHLTTTNPHYNKPHPISNTPFKNTKPPL